MLILGIDTATPWGTVALYEEFSGGDGEIIFEISFKSGRGGGEYLLSTLANFIKKAGRNFSDIDLIAVGTGPGSYTGIRVGLAAVKGLAEGLKKPVWGVHTLRIIAENARFGYADYIAAVIDARRGQVYAAFYQKISADLQELEPPRVIDAVEFATGLANFTPVVICGDGAKIYQDIWNRNKIVPGPRDWNRPSAGKLAQIASKEWDPNLPMNLTELKAYYLQRVEAEIRLEEKLHAINLQPNEN